MIWAILFLLASIALFGVLFHRWVIKDKSPADFAAVQKFIKRLRGQ